MYARHTYLHQGLTEYQKPKYILIFHILILLNDDQNDRQILSRSLLLQNVHRLLKNNFKASVNLKNLIKEHSLCNIFNLEIIIFFF